MNALRKLLYPLVHLFYPDLCQSCGENHPYADGIFCVSCESQIGKTELHLQADNEFTERFWGRLQLVAGAAYLSYLKGGKAQPVIYKIKYYRQKELGIKLGEQYGKLLRDAPGFHDAEVIVPVPLHPKRKHKRGYNQSDLFAKGLSETMGIPWVSNGLKRIRYTQSQTSKSRIERLKNMMEVFVVHNTKALEGRHVLLVDDVLTTGATLEACGSKILEVPGTRLSLATIAIAQH